MRGHIKGDTRKSDHDYSPYNGENFRARFWSCFLDNYKENDGIVLFTAQHSLLLVLLRTNLFLNETKPPPTHAVSLA